MIERTALKTEIELALTRFRVVALVGPRQSGKTTLARKFVPFDSLTYFDLENPLHLARLDQPMTALQDLRGLVVIYPGAVCLHLADQVEAFPLRDLIVPGALLSQ